MLVKLSNFIDTFNSRMGKFIAYATFLMAIISFTIVLLRYGLNIGSIALQESVIYMHAAVFLLGSAFTYQQNAHVRVDVFYRAYSPIQKALVDLCGSLFFMLPFSLYITVVCWHYVLESWQLMETSREPGGLPFVYILKSLILVFSISMLLQSISEIIKHTLSLLKKPVTTKEQS